MYREMGLCLVLRDNTERSGRPQVSRFKVSKHRYIYFNGYIFLSVIYFCCNWFGVRYMATQKGNGSFFIFVATG